MQKDNYGDFGMVLCISHMHPKLIKAIVCLTGVIEFLCCKTSVTIDDVKVKSNG